MAGQGTVLVAMAFQSSATFCLRPGLIGCWIHSFLVNITNTELVSGIGAHLLSVRVGGSLARTANGRTVGPPIYLARQGLNGCGPALLDWAADVAPRVVGTF
ncbi:MAG: hypothetical protein KDB01_10195 [Planctomycetaceae bacterium]|nr:hypothetical protein [Planctomycetaceae bacterium]